MTVYLTDDDYAEALANGIGRKVLYDRFYNRKWDKYRAINQELGRKRKGFDALQRPENNEFWYRVARSKGMSASTYNKRIGRGMSPEEAATSPLQQRKRKGDSDEG